MLKREHVLLWPVLWAGRIICVKATALGDGDDGYGDGPGSDTCGGGVSHPASGDRKWGVINDTGYGLGSSDGNGKGRSC